MGTLIGEIICTPNDVAVGQSVLVEVRDQAGQLLTNQNDTLVAINGVRGARQYLQFERPGSHAVRVTAVQKDAATQTIVKDSKSKVIEVTRHGGATRGDSSSEETPLLHLSRSPDSAYIVGLTLGFSPTQSGLRSSPSSRAPLRSLEDINTEAKRGMDTATQPPSETWHYDWEFGDGQRFTTTQAVIDHDFEATLAADELHKLFDVKVKITPPNARPYEVIRTLSVHNAYAICKRLGYLVPKVTYDRIARRLLNGYEIVLGIENLESEPIILEQQRIEANDVEHPSTPEALPSPITIPANSAAWVSLLVSDQMLTQETSRLAVYLAGKGAKGLAVRVEAQVDIAPHDHFIRGQQVGMVSVSHHDAVQKTLASGATRAAPRSQLSVVAINPGRLSESLAKESQGTPGTRGLESQPQLEDVQPGLVAATNLLTSPQGATSEELAPLVFGSTSRRAATTLPKEDDECDPSFIDPSLSGWVCQATLEQREVTIPACFENAKKGDILLAPGGDGLIGGLLHQLNPPQRYAHSGMITSDPTVSVKDGEISYEPQRITHSTAVVERAMEYPVGKITIIPHLLEVPAPTEGFREDVLKYMWPGVITQTTEAALFGEMMKDPESQKEFHVSSFSPSVKHLLRDDDWEIIPPLLIKPDPMTETAEVRTQLHDIADHASSQVGKSHYRLFCYSDPTIHTQHAPEDAGWAKGTYPTVCSSFVWSVLKSKGIRLEGSGATITAANLEPEDIRLGAEAADDTPDGLYLYHQEERREAAAFLQGYIKQRVKATLEEQAGILASLVKPEETSERIANQIVNTFAADAVNDQTQTGWRETGNANAVSPDNLIFWDSPALKGLYGFVTPARFRPAYTEVIPIHRWRKVRVTGSLEGRVTYQGQAMADTVVQLYDGLTTTTDTNGHYQFATVPVGSYLLRAIKEHQGQVLTANPLVDVISTQNQADVVLERQSRKLKLQGFAELKGFNVAQARQVLSNDFSLFVGPFVPHAEQSFGLSWQELRLEVFVSADWQTQQALVVTVKYTLYKGVNDHVETTHEEKFVLPAGQAQPWQSNATLPFEKGLELQLRFENEGA